MQAQDVVSNGDGSMSTDDVPVGNDAGGDAGGDGAVTVDCSGGRCPTVTQMSAGERTVCAVLSNGTVRCWGGGTAGQLGNGATADSMRPVVVTGISTAVQVSVGYEHACARLADGTLRCWGAGSNGRLGNGATDDATTPVQVSGITTAIDVSAGLYHSCAVLADHTAQCWGRGSDLGNGGVSSTSTPVAVNGLTDIADIEAGQAASNSSNLFSCALRRDGTVLCWGDNRVGQLGNGTLDPSYTPIAVPGITTARALSIGSEHACVVLANNSLSCWGDNASGEIRGEPFDRILSPVSVTTVSNVARVSAGASFTCALGMDGVLQCWGNNGRGQLGRGFQSPVGMRIETTPAPALGTGTVTQFTTGDSHACAFSMDGATRCWGNNDFGEVGDGTSGSFEFRPTPTPVAW